METKDELITVIRPITRWEVLNVKQILAFRDLLLALGIRDIKLRYRQTLLGIAWVVLQPLITSVIFGFVFGEIAKLKAPNGLPYFLFSYAGMLGWNVFAGTITKSAGSLVQNSALVSKVYFPKTIVPLSSMFSTFVDFGVALAMFFILLPIFGVGITLPILLTPIWVLLLLMAALGLGLYCSALMVTYRDVQYILPVAVTFLLYASPVPYALDMVPEKLQWIIAANPLTGVLEGMRWSLLGTSAPNPLALTYSVVMILCTFVLGALLFGRAERRFADVI
ncbi:MAG: ABC transporter permease [Chlorobia bacterium]|nr:ABC transporter permease [Fimbriimonadaceae bacterium]